MDERHAEPKLVGAAGPAAFAIEPRDRSRDKTTSLSTIAREFASLQKHTAASRTLNDWVAGAQAFALLSAAVDSGIVDALSTPSSPAQIAAATHVNLPRVQDVLLALEAYGIARRDDGLCQLAPDWTLLASPTAIQPLACVLRAAAVKIRTLHAILEDGEFYTALPGDDALALAQGLGASGLSSASHIMNAGLGQNMPELKALWEAGARHLEMGCGVGNNLLGIALTYPTVTAVGLEIQPAIARETQRRANLLGIADRVQVRQIDACDLQDEAAYDTAQWSETFFPAPSRPGALRALKRALKPGGYAFMPLLSEVPPDVAARRKGMLGLALRALRSNPLFAVAFLSDVLGDTPARRRREERLAALQNLLYGKWGVPVRTARELQSEVEEAGFRVLRTMPVPAGQFSEARGLLLAVKPASVT